MEKIINGKTYLIVDPIRMRVFDYVSTTPPGYVVAMNLAYFCTQYERWVAVNCGFFSDGATSAPDLNSWSWLFHDKLCITREFADGSQCDDWKASRVLKEILHAEGHHVREHVWFWATYAWRRTASAWAALRGAW